MRKPHMVGWVMAAHLRLCGIHTLPVVVDIANCFSGWLPEKL